MTDESKSITTTVPGVAITPIAIPSIPTQEKTAALKEICKIAAYSGLLNSNAAMSNIAQRTADAFFIAMSGIEIGVPTMTSLRHFYSIDGKLGCSGQLLLGLMRRGGIQVDIPDPGKVTDEATVRIQRPGGDWKSYTYTLKMAGEAQLLGKTNWKKSPREMLIWRAVSMGSRFEASDVTGGLYTVEELAPDTPVDEYGAPLGGIVTSPTTELPPADDFISTEEAREMLGSGDQRRIETGGHWSNIVENKLTFLKTLKAQFDLDEPAALKLVGKNGWQDYATGKEAGIAVKTAFEASQKPAKPKATPAVGAARSGIAPNGGLRKTPWTADSIVDFSQRLWDVFDMTAKQVLDALGKSDFQTDYESFEDAWAAVANVAVKSKWPVIAEQVTYHEKKYLDFIFPAPYPNIRAYGRTSTFREQVGQEYFDANSFDDFKADKTVHDIEPLRIEWEAKGGNKTGAYLVATKCTPVLSEGDESLDDIADEDLAEFLGVPA